MLEEDRSLVVESLSAVASAMRYSRDQRRYELAPDKCYPRGPGVTQYARAAREADALLKAADLTERDLQEVIDRAMPDWRVYQVEGMTSRAVLEDLRRIGCMYGAKSARVRLGQSKRTREEIVLQS